MDLTHYTLVSKEFIYLKNSDNEQMHNGHSLRV